MALPVPLLVLYVTLFTRNLLQMGKLHTCECNSITLDREGENTYFKGQNAYSEAVNRV